MTNNNLIIRNKLENRIQKILYSVFEFGPKTIPDKKDNVTYVACPYCGDSKRDKNKKRLTIYWDTGTCYCYNCETYKKISKFITDFKGELSFEEKSWVHSNNYKKIFTRNRSDTLFKDREDFKKLLYYSIPIKYLCDIMGLKPADKNHNYLKSRSLSLFNDNFLEYYPKVGDYKDNVVILNKITNDRIIGITIRDSRPNARNKYYVYTLQKIYEKFIKNKYNLIKDKVDLKVYDTISYYYGFFDLDFEKPITVFEGPIDRMFFPNSVAISSLWRDYSFFKNLDNVRFFFDDDKTAKKHSIKILKDKKHVFLWDKFKKDKKIKNDFKIKDMNDIILLSKKHKVHYFKDTINYFSNDPLDLMKL